MQFKGILVSLGVNWLYYYKAGHFILCTGISSQKYRKVAYNGKSQLLSKWLCVNSN